MKRNDREMTDIKEIETIISKSDVCRIAFANDNIPYLVTMNFGYTGRGEHTLFFHCANEGRKLEMIKKNNMVCFEMDTDHNLYTGEKGCDCGMHYKSLVGYGKISIITEDDEKIAGLKYIMSHYCGEGEHIFDKKVLDRTTVLRLDISEMTGKKC